MASTQFRRFLSHRPLGKWKVFWEAKTNVCSIFVLFPQHLLGLIQSRMLGQVYFGDWPFSDIPLSFISHQAMHLTKGNGWNAAWGIWCSCLSLFLHQAQFAPLKSSSNTQAGASFFPFVPKEVFTSMDKASQLEAKMFWNAPGNQRDATLFSMQASHVHLTLSGLGHPGFIVPRNHWKRMPRCDQQEMEGKKVQQWL